MEDIIYCILAIIGIAVALFVLCAFIYVYFALARRTGDYAERLGHKRWLWSLIAFFVPIWTQLYLMIQDREEQKRLEF